MTNIALKGALGIAVGGAMLAAPAQAYDVSVAGAGYANANPIVQISSFHESDDDYWKDRRKARKKWAKEQRKADKRYWKEREKRAKYRAKHRYDDDYYYEPVYRDTRVWRGRDGRVYCRKSDGTTGLIVGGALGALLGREIDTRGDRTIGTVLGAAGGAILGREIERGRCR